MTETERLKAARDAALATLAAARTMLDATGAALADATKRIEALTLTATEAYRKGYFAGEQRSTVAIVAWLRDDAAKCDCFAHSEGECACGAWSDYKRVLETDIADRLECGEHLAAQEQEQTDD